MPFDETAYQQALDYLYRFVDYSLVRNFRHTPEKFDLSRMETTLESIGNPHQRYPVIHVAGTKGKGSTSALIASALRAAGYQVGLYTSPHLQDFTERIQVNGQPITKPELVTLIGDLRPKFDQVEQITWFEITTALAFEYFLRQRVDVAVVEVGLGGRLDATNVVKPLVSVITSLSMDHTAILGDTLDRIAYEKAGIIKPGCPVVSSVQMGEAQAVIEQVAAERGSPLVKVGYDVRYQPLSHDLNGQMLRLEPDGTPPVEVYIPLLGLHQVENAANAYAALQIVAQKGLPLNIDQIRQGFARVYWPARFELLRRDPPLIVDSAHNRDSARRLRETLADYLPGREVVLLFGASDDKDIPGMFEELLPYVREVVTTQSIHPRAASAENLAALAHPFDRPVQAVATVEEALEVGLQRTGANAVLLAAGSLFIAAAVRAVWQMRGEPVV